MKHGKKMQQAMQEVFEELMASSPQELSEMLGKSEIGPIGYLMRETGTIDALLVEQYEYSNDSLITFLDGSMAEKDCAANMKAVKAVFFLVSYFIRNQMII